MLPVISPLAETGSVPGTSLDACWNVSFWPGTLSVAWTCRLTGKPTATVGSAGATTVIVPYAFQVKTADPLAPFWSVAVTVTLYWPPVLGVPEMSPPGLMARAGRAVLRCDQERGDGAAHRISLNLGPINLDHGSRAGRRSSGGSPGRRC